MAVGGLTERELEALRLVAAGKSDHEIAAVLGMSHHTARFHVDNARRKLDATNRAHAVALLVNLGGLECDPDVGVEGAEHDLTTPPPVGRD